MATPAAAAPRLVLDNTYVHPLFIVLRECLDALTSLGAMFIGVLLGAT
jgi:hypothetical protein